MKRKKERLSVYITSKNRARGVWRDVIINNRKSYYIAISLYNDNLYIYKVGNRSPSAMTTLRNYKNQLRILLKQRYPNKIIYIYYR